MDLMMCTECEKVWLTASAEDDEPRSCTDCGHLLTLVEHESPAPSQQ
jgi:phage FluMu protein Com